MGLRCGIDLGTTYSAISWYDSANNRVETVDLEAADGNKIIRSVVYYPGAGSSPVVGDTAWNAAKAYPERVIVGIKRAMGTDFKTAPMDGVQYTPEQVSAEILRVLVRDAQTFFAEEVRDVVITVPAYFGDSERAATEEAGKIAGLNVLGLLPEPHAAALAYSIAKVTAIEDRHLLVYDLGGGTFDVTLIHATKEKQVDGTTKLKIDTLCKDGNAQRGGLDWDRVLLDIVAEKARQEYGIDVTQDAKNEAIVLDNCEKAKRDLSRTDEVIIAADQAGHQVKINVREFEDRTSSLLLETQLLLEKVLADAEKQYGIGKDQIDVMLSGGATKMPMVRKMIERVTGKPPLQHGNPELLVTIGAAYWAHLMEAGQVIVPVPKKGDGIQQEIIVVEPGGLTDVSVYAVGVEVVQYDAGGRESYSNAVVIPAGARYNQTYEREFYTVRPGQTEVMIRLYKGESPNLSECERLMDFWIRGLPPGRPAGQPINVSLNYDGSGIIRGTAIDLNTSNKCDILFDRRKRQA